MGGTPVPGWLTAAWERRYIIAGGSDRPDRSVNVRNIQTPTLFGDVRIPKDRPAFPNATSLGDLSDAELRTLYAQEGFSGFTSVAGAVTTWHHEIDYQPPDGSIDIGRIEIAGGRNMFEHGVQSSYLEHWWNLASGDGWFFGVKVLRRGPGGSTRVHQILSLAGDHFIYARNRPEDLPQAPSLAALIDSTRATRPQVLEFLDCEVSHGYVLGGRQPWEIQFSTLPFLEGQRLDFVDEIVVDPKTGAVTQRGERPDEVWAFEVNTLDVEDLVVLFPVTGGAET